jgi:hypothetical protein
MTKVESFSGLAAVACLKIFFDSFKSSEVFVMDGFFSEIGVRNAEISTFFDQ